MSPLLIKISKDFATIWTTIDPIGNGASFAGRLFARDDYFRAITEPAKKFFAVLPAQPELGNVRKTKSANNISEEVSLGFVEVGVHHRALGPIDEPRLAQFAVEVVRDFVGDSLAGDFHRSDLGKFYIAAA